MRAETGSRAGNCLHRPAIGSTRSPALLLPPRQRSTLAPPCPVVEHSPQVLKQSQQRAQCSGKALRSVETLGPEDNSKSNKQENSTNKHWWRAALLCCSLALLSTCLPQHGAASSAAAASSGSWAKDLLSFVLHIDKHLNSLILQHGKTTYLILWLIVFCETGLVLTPFLPGDSLLFTAGTFAARGSLDLGLLLVTFLTSAILGDAVNYAVGKWLGGKALNYRFINKVCLAIFHPERDFLTWSAANDQEYIGKTERYFAKHGGRAIVLARFVPIVRTFAPFVAGIGSMAYKEFAAFNVAGALLWTFLFAVGGFLFGNLPFVQQNLPIVMIAIVLVSVLPLGLEILEARREGNKSGPPGATSGA